MKLTSKNLLSLCLFLCICYGVAYIGAIYEPGEWYKNLNKAPWSPPNIAFPIVWSILYFFIAVTGWLIFNTKLVRLQALWSFQLVLNAMWSWIFFGEHWVLLGLIDLLMLVTAVIALIISCWQNQLKLATFLMIPYLLWLAIATSLNSYVLIAN